MLDKAIDAPAYCFAVPSVTSLSSTNTYFGPNKEGKEQLLGYP